MSGTGAPRGDPVPVVHYAFERGFSRR
jgi:hypothetical protein